MKKELSGGQTLLEVVVVVGIMALLLTALASFMVTATARARLERQRAVATRVAQEGMDWVKLEKERADWDTQFWPIGTNIFCVYNTSLYDLNSTPDGKEAPPLAPCAVEGNVDLDGDTDNQPERDDNQIYYREVGLQQVSDATGDHYIVTVTVTWPGGDGKVELMSKVYPRYEDTL